MATDLTENSPDILLQESEKLLRLAENLQEKCERQDRFSLLFLAIAASVMIIGVQVTSYFLLAEPLSDPERARNRYWAIFSFSYALGSAFGIFYFVSKSARLLRRDRRALLSIVDMLREVEKGIAENHQMSTLERAEFRIRLARFDVGPGLMPWSS